MKKTSSWLKKAAQAARKALEAFDAEDDPDEPAYDPVHLGGVLTVCLVVVGALYWLLWTLLVYEGGLFLKVRAGLAIAFTSKTLADSGYRGSPYAMGVFEGWVGNAAALLLCVLVLAALHRLYAEARERSAKK